MRGPKVSQYETELPDLEREWKNIQTNVERSVSIENDIEVLESGLEQINSRLMRVENVASNYEFFYGLESESGVVLKQFSQGTASTGDELPLAREELVNFSVIPYELSMDGTIQQILKFIDLLDRQEHIVRLDQLTIVRPSDAEEGDIVLTARLWCHVLAVKDD